MSLKIIGRLVGAIILALSVLATLSAALGISIVAELIVTRWSCFVTWAWSSIIPNLSSLDANLLTILCLIIAAATSARSMASRSSVRSIVAVALGLVTILAMTHANIVENYNKDRNVDRRLFVSQQGAKEIGYTYSLIKENYNHVRSWIVNDSSCDVIAEKEIKSYEKKREELNLTERNIRTKKIIENYDNCVEGKYIIARYFNKYAPMIFIYSLIFIPVIIALGLIRVVPINVNFAEMATQIWLGITMALVVILLSQALRFVGLEGLARPSGPDPCADSTVRKRTFSCVRTFQTAIN